MGRAFVLATTGLIFLTATVQAQVLFSDGFETYAVGSLDKNDGAGPNQAPNGSGNPWWGPIPSNGQVALNGDTYNGPSVNANTGTHMIRATTGAPQFDQDYYNLAFRLHGGNNFTGNVAVKWSFYDPLGAGGTNFQDYIALGNYSTVPTNTDHPANINTNTLGGVIQRLSLGASNPAGSNPNFYQARVVGATDGLAGAPTWFNTTVPRTVGWHTAEIVLGTDQGANTTVSYYIDNLTTPILTHAISTAGGVNVIEVNSGFGSATGYFDDVSVFTPVPEPSSLALMACGGLVMVWRRSRRTS
jgi:hypothetical protein